MSTFFGKLIKDMREERSLTIEELAKISGLTSVQLTEIEEGTSKISILLFIKLLRSLSIVVEDSAESSSKTFVSYTKDIQNFDNADGNVKFLPLTRGVGTRHMTPFILQIYDKEWSDMNSDRGGEDFIYVLSGAIEILHGNKRYHLLPGDSIYFDSTIAHSVKNIDSNYSKLLIVLY